MYRFHEHTEINMLSKIPMGFSAIDRSLEIFFYRFTDRTGKIILRIFSLIHVRIISDELCR